MKEFFHRIDSDSTTWENIGISRHKGANYETYYVYSISGIYFTLEDEPEMAEVILAQAVSRRPGIEEYFKTLDTDNEIRKEETREALKKSILEFVAEH